MDYLLLLGLDWFWPNIFSTVTLLNIYVFKIHNSLLYLLYNYFKFILIFIFIFFYAELYFYQYINTHYSYINMHLYFNIICTWTYMYLYSYNTLQKNWKAAAVITAAKCAVAKHLAAVITAAKHLAAVITAAAFQFFCSDNMHAYFIFNFFGTYISTHTLIRMPIFLIISTGTYISTDILIGMPKMLSLLLIFLFIYKYNCLFF